MKMMTTPKMKTMVIMMSVCVLVWLLALLLLLEVVPAELAAAHGHPPARLACPRRCGCQPTLSTCAPTRTAASAAAAAAERQASAAQRPGCARLSTKPWSCRCGGSVDGSMGPKTWQVHRFELQGAVSQAAAALAHRGSWARARACAPPAARLACQCLHAYACARAHLLRSVLARHAACARAPAPCVVHVCIALCAQDMGDGIQVSKLGNCVVENDGSGIWVKPARMTTAQMQVRAHQRPRSCVVCTCLWLRASRGHAGAAFCCVCCSV